MKANENTMRDILKPLESIQKIDTPDNLYKSIHSRIIEETRNHVSMTTAYSIAASFLLLLSINVFVLLYHDFSIPEKQNIAQAFQLMPNNDLYK